MRLDPNIEIPVWLRRLLSQNLDRRFDLENRFISVTGLLQPAHMLRLKQRHWDDLVVNPIDLLPSAIGTAWHEVSAKWDDPDGASEVRIEVEYDDWTISGQPDYFDSTTIVDRKTAKVWSRVFGKPEWEQQLNLYRWLLHRGAGYDIGKLEVHVIYLDWISAYAKKHHDSGLPPLRFEVLQLPVWDYDRCEAFVRQRLELLVNPTPAICTPEERWERGECWAVMKKGRKSALKRCDTLQQAVDLANSTTTGYVEHRPGEAVRCRSWCDVATFCPFGQALEEVESNG